MSAKINIRFQDPIVAESDGNIQYLISGTTKDALLFSGVHFMLVKRRTAAGYRVLGLRQLRKLMKKVMILSYTVDIGMIVQSKPCVASDKLWHDFYRAGELPPVSDNVP